MPARKSKESCEEGRRFLADVFRKICQNLHSDSRGEGLLAVLAES